MKHKRQTRRYLIVFFTGVVVATVISAAINTRVDPWRVSGSPWADPALDPYRDISGMTRTGKAGLVLARQDWQGAIFGSSRVISALDPQAPGWGGKEIVNLGMPGAFLYENVAMAEYFIRRQQQAELILFGVDPGDLTSTMDTRGMSDFMNSPLNPDGALDRRLGFDGGLEDGQSHHVTLGLKSKGTPGEYNDHGLRDRPVRGSGGIGGAAGGRNQLKFIRDRFIDDARITPENEAEVKINADKARKLESLMRECRERGVRMILFLHPNHVLLKAASRDQGKQVTPYEKDRRELAGKIARVNAMDLPGPAVEWWDFYSFHPYNRERVRPLEGEPNALVHWRDLEHYTKEVGNGMLSMMMGWPAANPDLSAYGVKLAPEEVDARIAALQDDYQTYLQEEGEGDVAWKEELVNDSLMR